MAEPQACSLWFILNEANEDRGHASLSELFVISFEPITDENTSGHKRNGATAAASSGASCGAQSTKTPSKTVFNDVFCDGEDGKSTWNIPIESARYECVSST